METQIHCNNLFQIFSWPTIRVRDMPGFLAPCTPEQPRLRARKRQRRGTTHPEPRRKFTSTLPGSGVPYNLAQKKTPRGKLKSGNSSRRGATTTASCHCSCLKSRYSHGCSTLEIPWRKFVERALLASLREAVRGCEAFGNVPTQNLWQQTFEEKIRTQRIELLVSAQLRGM